MIRATLGSLPWSSPPLLPTALHLFIAIFAVQAWLPRPWRYWVTQNIRKAIRSDTDIQSPFIGCFGLSAIWMVPVVVFVGLCYLLWTSVLSTMGASYIDGLLWFAVRIGAV